MISTAPLGRRSFLRHAGRASFGVVVTGMLTACTSTLGDGAGAGAGTPQASARADSTRSHPPSAGTSTGELLDWHRVDLAFVSAYIMVRGNEAAIVDTGVAGSEGDIGQALTGVGLDWSAVGHVILTHRHPDHAGSAAAVLKQATGATAYAGRADAGQLPVPDPVTVVTDGDDVLGLRIITTPGHTPGHIAVLDQATGLLVAGDALVGGGESGVMGPDPRYTEDLVVAYESVRKLTDHAFDTVLFGHGEPVLTGGGAAVAALAERGTPTPSPSASAPS